MRYTIFHKILLFSSVLFLTACQDRAEGLGGYFESPRPSENTKYNVLVISFDTLRADALGVYGYKRPTSPNIDAFAAKSLLFERAYSTAQATPTSFASAWTGMLPFRVFRGWKLTDHETLAQVFMDAGYKTAGFTNNQQLLVERGFATGFQNYKLLKPSDDDDDDQLLATTIDWLENNHSSKFFAWFHFLSPHAPYSHRQMASEFYDSSYTGRFEKRVPVVFEIENDAELKRARNLYDGEIFYADNIFQTLLDRLEGLGIAEKTIIVLTSDHGEEFMDHGGIQHDSVYDEIIRIPLIIYHPAINKGTRTDLLFSNVDFYQTLPALADLETTKLTDGINLLEAVPVNRAVIATSMTGKKHQYALLQEQDKYHLDCRPKFAERLFNMATDPNEKNDIALDQPDKVAHLYETLELFTGGDPCKVLHAAIAGKTIESDLLPEQIENLRALGYIQ